MKQYLFKDENYTTSRWTGGSTKELCIYPPESSYLDRNFIWRVSSATVETEESDFSRLPDYDRVLMVLDGEVVLSYEGERVARLQELEQDRFDGAWRTKSFGKITDFNLMVRKGSEGYLDLIYPQNERQSFGSSYESGKSLSTHALYCHEGYFVVTACGKEHMVSAGEIFVVSFEKDEKEEYSIMGEGIIVRAQIFYDEMQDELSPTVIPHEKASFDDFKCCVYLANVQFKWAKYIVKKLKYQWFDEELSAAIRKIERFYLTVLVFLAGVAGLCLLMIPSGIGEMKIAAALMGWLAADCLIISPLMYMAVVPKPVRRHIKNIDELTPYEQRVRAEKSGSDEHLDKLMKKYKNSGKNLGR